MQAWFYHLQQLLASLASTAGDAGVLALDRGGREVAATAAEEGVALCLLQAALSTYFTS